MCTVVRQVLGAFSSKESSPEPRVQALEVHFDWQTQKVLSFLGEVVLRLTHELEVALIKHLQGMSTEALGLPGISSKQNDGCIGLRDPCFADLL